MDCKSYLIAFVLFIACDSSWAKEVTDTVVSSKLDTVIVSYVITQNHGQITIMFQNARKKLGATSNNQYKKLEEIVVVFFDWIGNYGDDMSFSGIDLSAFMIPEGVNYEVSKDGYFLLNDNNTKLSMELNSGEKAELSIPLFLAHYEGKRRYKVFSRCDDLKINLSKNVAEIAPDVPIQPLPIPDIIEPDDPDGTDIDVDVAVANSIINRINVLLPEQNEYPFSDELKQAISSLRDISFRTSDSNLSSRIRDVLSKCKSRENELRDSVIAAEKEAAMIAQARQDSIAEVTQQEAEKTRKQNLWLIIGGVILAVFAFVGNQAFQHFRNVKNQKNYMDMQQKAINRAESEAKRLQREMTRSQINRVQGKVRGKTRSAIHDGLIAKNANKGKNIKEI